MGRRRRERQSRTDHDAATSRYILGVLRHKCGCEWTPLGRVCKLAEMDPVEVMKYVHKFYRWHSQEYYIQQRTLGPSPKDVEIRGIASGKATNSSFMGPNDDDDEDEDGGGGSDAADACEAWEVQEAWEGQEAYEVWQGLQTELEASEARAVANPKRLPRPSSSKKEEAARPSSAPEDDVLLDGECRELEEDESLQAQLDEQKRRRRFEIQHGDALQLELEQRRRQLEIQEGDGMQMQLDRLEEKRRRLEQRFSAP